MRQSAVFTGLVLAFSLVGAVPEFAQAADESCKAFPEGQQPKKDVAAKPKRNRTPTAKKDEPKEVTVQEGLSLLSKLAAEQVDVAAEIKRERHPLSVLLRDDDQNLAVQAPLTVMNGPQRMLAIVLSEGHETITIPTTNQRVKAYPFFSYGTDVTKGRMIIGNEDVIEIDVNALRRQARGDKSASAVTMALGPGGTGKTERLAVLAAGVETKTRQIGRKFGIYTFELNNLEKIPSLLPFLTSTTVDGKQRFEPIEAPLHDSPVIVFPPEVQKLIIDKAASVASPMLEGIRPTPHLDADPITAFVRTEIINHYASEKGRALTTTEIIDVLSKHVTITRIYLDRKSGKMPLIDAQGRDIDMGGLFAGPNFVVRFASGKGPSHPMAWYYNGKVPGSHLNGLGVDEVLRYEQEMRNIMLGLLESRTVSAGGAPTFSLSNWILAGSNTAVLDELRKEGVNTAFLDRFQKVWMRWPVDPHQAAQTLLLGKLKDLKQIKLNTEEPAQAEPAMLRDLFPRRQSLSQYETPNYRYRLIDGDGESAVDIAPHTITTMAEIIGATRMNTDPAKAAQLFPGKMAGTEIYKNPIIRLQVLEGMNTHVNASQLGELHKLSQLTREGEKGISQREANIWWAESLDEARREGNGNTLTPELAIQVLRRLLISGTIEYPSQEVRMEWEGLITSVANELLLPRLDADLTQAMAKGNSMVLAAYHEMVEEFSALDDDPDATKYISARSSQERTIRRDRKQKVEEIYKKRTGSNLNISKIALFHGNQARLGGAGPEPDQALFNAIAEYYTRLHSEMAGIAAMAAYIRTGEGNDEVRSTYSAMVKSMEKLGYTERSMNQAILQVDSARSQSGQD